MVADKIYINGISVIAPGMVDPGSSLEILRGDKPWQAEPLPKLVPAYLPANERRRTTPVIKLALQTIQSLLHSEDDLDQTPLVFASSDGDLFIEDKICQSLALPDKIVSPTQFHNSVHNAPAGYWAIASSMHSASVSLSAGDGTFAAGLIDAVTQVVSEQQTVLFVAYDAVAPEPLDAVRHFDYSLGVGLRLGINKEAGCFGSIRISLNELKRNISVCQNNSLESLRTGNPIGAGIPLFEVLARKSDNSIVVPHIMNKFLLIEVSQP